MTVLTIELAIAALARRQAGAFSRRQAIAAGASPSYIDRRLRSGLWLELLPGVYALPSHPGTFLRQCWAAVLSQPGAVVAGTSAAALWRFTDFRPGHPEIAVPPGGNARCPIATVHRLGGARATHLDGLPITTRAQTMFDVAGRSSFGKVEAALDDHLLRRPAFLSELEERLAYYDGTRRRGITMMRLLVEDRREEGWQPAESELERRLVRILRRLRGRPRFVLQHELGWRDAAVGRVDVWFPDSAVLIEADGRRWHARLKDFDRDRWRDNVAVAHGVLPMRFTWTHVVAQPQEVLALVESVLARGRTRATSVQ